MHPSHIGDSYDFVKRALLCVAPKDNTFLVIPMFTDIPSAEQERAYGTLLGASLVESELRNAPGVGHTARQNWLDGIRNAVGHRQSHVFLDPDTGIRLRRRMPRGRDSRAFVDIAEIVGLLEAIPDRMLLCFDQSLSRGAESTDRAEKLEFLHRSDTEAAYFSSHACFLAASKDRDALERWIAEMRKIGISDTRLQRHLPVMIPLPE